MAVCVVRSVLISFISLPYAVKPRALFVPIEGDNKTDVVKYLAFAGHQPDEGVTHIDQ